MTTRSGYDIPGEPDDNDRYDDHDSDIDLDLNELDSQQSPSPARPALGKRQSSLSRLSFDFARRIPLRNLRFAGRRQPQREDEGEELDELVESNEVKRKRQSTASEGFGGVEDDAPLLSNGHVRQTSRNEFYAQPERNRRKRGLLARLFHRRTPSVHLSAVGPTTDSEQDDSTPPSDPSTTRTIPIAGRQHTRYPANAVSHAKYTPASFLPLTLYNEFKFFLNLYFLLVALSQILPVLRIGYLSTYVAPLAFVISITLGKEAWDDILRRRRDAEANGEIYCVLAFRGEGGGKKKREVEGGDMDLNGRAWKKMKPARDLKVGDVLVLGKDQRVPADVVILKSFSTESDAEREDIPGDEALISGPDDVLEEEAAAGQQLDNETTSQDPSGGGEAFIRTDQLDGETDWKLRLASPLAQTLPTSDYQRLKITAEKPSKRVNDFVGTIELLPQTQDKAAYDPHIASNGHPPENAEAAGEGELSRSSPLTIDNTAWANTVLASSTTVHAAVIYTGPQTRAALSTSMPRSKTGLLEIEINSLTKILCILTLSLSFILIALEGFSTDTEGRRWYVGVLRFLILFSTIVPISLRVNLDLGKSVYAWFIHRDPDIPGTVVRTSTIPEDLGRIEFLLSDKTGTLTRNEMLLRKIHVGTVSYGGEAMEEVVGYISQAFKVPDEGGSAAAGGLFTPSKEFGAVTAGTTRTRREIGVRVRDLVLALAVCHNVTPTTDIDEEGRTVTAYQASSPDEIAIVKWTEHVGLRLAHRDRKSITLRFTGDDRLVVRAEILNVFPFTSDSKRMGIIVRFVRHADTMQDEEGEIVFFQKGADTVMSSIVASNDWLDEETANMAREGLRTLVIGRKNLSREQYAAFSNAYSTASLSLSGRETAMAKVVKQQLESNLELLGVTGVEDKLQPMVKASLELLRNAGVKIWMLTGDKVETARCVAVNSKLVSRGQYIHTIAGLKRKEAALDALNLLHSQPNAALLIDGQSLAIYLQWHQDVFISAAVRLSAVIACRCSPTQKADIARLIRTYTKKRIACIGDGGNDVSMIQAADIGVGIVGKEGKQASLAADFSIMQFAHLTKLLVWHGRNSYKRSAKLAQFVIHRGLIISVCQTVFSIANHFEPIALYRDWLLVGYATIYTMMPVFSLVLDMDVDEGLANLYPELYKELTLGKSLSYKTFFIWVGISIYQGLIIQGGSELLVPGFQSAPTRPSNSQDPAAETYALTHSPGFKRMVALSFTVLVINELVMVAAEITTWHPIMVFSICGTAMIYFGSLPLLGDYFDLEFLVSLGFWWRFAAISAASLVPVWGGKIIRRTVRPPSYRKVRGV